MSHVWALGQQHDTVRSACRRDDRRTTDFDAVRAADVAIRRWPGGLDGFEPRCSNQPREFFSSSLILSRRNRTSAASLGRTVFFVRDEKLLIGDRNEHTGDVAAGRTGRLRRSALCSARRGLRAQARVSSRDHPDHPLVGLLVIAKTVDTARNQSAATQTIHRPLKNSDVDDHILAFGPAGDSSHQNRS
jgi:hypothetical protein